MIMKDKGLFISVRFQCVPSKEKQQVKEYFSAFCALLFDKFDLDFVKCSEEVSR